MPSAVPPELLQRMSVNPWFAALPEDLRERWRSPSIGHRPSVELPIAVVRPWVVRMMAREARARIDKARAMLGYEPAVSLTEGMRITGDWARWAGLAPASLAS